MMSYGGAFGQLIVLLFYSSSSYQGVISCLDHIQKCRYSEFDGLFKQKKLGSTFPCIVPRLVTHINEIGRDILLLIWPKYLHSSSLQTINFSSDHFEARSYGNFRLISDSWIQTRPTIHSSKTCRKLGRISGISRYF